MITPVSESQAEFYRRFLMARQSIDPEQHGVQMGKEEFIDLMVEEFNNAFRSWSIDELLLHPRQAMRFCDDVRYRHAFYDLPDDMILRAILYRRKNP